MLLGGMWRQGLIEDVLHETGCLAISQVSSELELHGRLWEFELNSGVMCGHKLRSDGCGGKKDKDPSTDYNGVKYRESRVIWYLNDYITSDSAVKNLSIRGGKKHEFT